MVVCFVLLQGKGVIDIKVRVKRLHGTIQETDLKEFYNVIFYNSTRSFSYHFLCHLLTCFSVPKCLYMFFLLILEHLKFSVYSSFPSPYTFKSVTLSLSLCFYVGNELLVNKWYDT